MLTHINYRNELIAQNLLLIFIFFSSETELNVVHYTDIPSPAKLGLIIWTKYARNIGSKSSNEWWLKTYSAVWGHISFDRDDHLAPNFQISKFQTIDRQYIPWLNIWLQKRGYEAINKMSGKKDVKISLFLAAKKNTSLSNKGDQVSLCIPMAQLLTDLTTVNNRAKWHFVLARLLTNFSTVSNRANQLAR